MTSPTPTERFRPTDRSERLLLLVVGLCYLPFTFLGLGSDGDADAVVRAVHAWLATGHYVYSRPPSFPVHELSVAMLYPWGGSLATNLGSLGMALLQVAAVLHVCRSYGVTQRLLIACATATHPLFIVAATSTMDYTWSTGLAWCGLSAWLGGRYTLAGVLLGLGVGGRLTAGLIVAGFVMSALWSRDRPIRAVAHVAVVSVLTTAACYFPAFASSSYDFRFLHYTVPDWWGGWGLVARFVYKNIYFVGLQTALVLVAVLAVSFRSAGVSRAGRSRPLLILSGTVVLFVEALFLKVPIETAYLLPALPFAWILAGHVLARRQGCLIALVIAQASYNVVSVNLLRPDVQYAARTGTFGAWIEPGALITDTQERLRRERARRAASTFVRHRIVEMHPHLWPGGEAARLEASALLARVGRRPMPIDGRDDPWSAGQSVLEPIDTQEP